MALPTTLTNVTTRKLASTISNLWSKITSNFLKPVSGTITLSSNTTTKIGTLNGTDVNLQMPTIPAAANNGKLNLQVNTGTATQLFTANQSGNSTLTLKQGSNASLSVSSNTVTIAATDTKNTVGVGAASHAYDHNYYVPFTTSTQSAASNAQSYTELTGEMETRTPLLRFVDDPIKGMQGFMAGNQIGRFNGVPPENADGKLITVGMDGQLIVSSILDTDVALASNVEPLLTLSRGVAKEHNSANGAIYGLYCDSGSGGSDKYGIYFGSYGGLTYNNSYIIHTVSGDSSGYMHLFEGIAQYAYSAASASSASYATSAGNATTATTATTAQYLACTSSNEVNIKKDPTQSASLGSIYLNYRDADGTASSSVVQLLDYYFCDRKQASSTTNLRAGHFISTNASTAACGMEIHRNNGSKDTGLLVERSDKTYNGKTLALIYGIGTGGDNYGIWSDPLGCWAIKGVASENKVYIHAGGTGTSANFISFVAGSIGTAANTIYFP